MKSALKKSPSPKDDLEVFDNIIQGSEDWHLIKRGIPSASKFATVLAEGKDGDTSGSARRDRYMKQLAGEILTGEVGETFKSEAMSRGNFMEPEALQWYERTRFADLQRVGFVTRSITRPLGGKFKIGCSPDAIIPAKRKAIEIKTMRPDLLIDVSQKGAAGFPLQHRAQIQGALFVLGYETVDLVLYYRGWKSPPLFTVGRDEKYIANLESELDKFNYELDALVKRVKESGKGW